MSINPSKSIAIITNEISQQLDKHKPNDKYCLAGTGNIILNDAKGCSIMNENKCVDSDMTLDAISQAITNVWEDLSDKQKMELLPYYHINMNSVDVSNEIKNILRQKCHLHSLATETISQSNLIINDCQNDTIIDTNTGSIKGNCYIKTLLGKINNPVIKLYPDDQIELLGYLIKYNGMHFINFFTIGFIMILCVGFALIMFIIHLVYSDQKFT